MKPDLKKWRRNTLLTVLLAGIFAGSGAVAAWGVSTYGAWQGVAVGGPYSYQARGFVQNSPYNGGGQVEVTNASSVPIGYMGTNAFLYKGAALCQSAATSYNAAPVKNKAVATPANATCGSGNYRGRGDYSFYTPTTGLYTSGNINFSPYMAF